MASPRSGAKGISAQAPGEKHGRLGFAAFAAAVAAVIWWGWLNRADATLRPEEGAGYALGLVGAVMMLALLLYPLRKRLRSMRGLGPASLWFRLHMLLGVVGPTLVILHSDFNLQSTNATVALVSMLTVAGSGLAGRYLYGRIHRGLYGQRLEAQALRDDVTQARQTLSASVGRAAEWREDLLAFEAKALAPTPSLAAALGRAIWIGGAAGRSRKAAAARIEAELSRESLAQGWTDGRLRARRREERAQLNSYYAALWRAATLGVYERLFALWHVLHVPLFVILVLTAIIHVVAVHLY